MSDGDAEWFDVNEPIPPLKPPSPDNPANPPPRPNEGRDFGLRPMDEAAQELSYHTTTIIVSVVCVFIVIFLILLVLYLFVLRKKLQKISRTQASMQYTQRVEDIAHVEIDDNSKLYVNTTDLQKLVSNVRLSKKTESKLPNPATDYPDVIKVGRPPAALPKSNYINDSYQSENKRDMPPTLSESDANQIYSNIDVQNLAMAVTRPAPPPPIASIYRENKLMKLNSKVEDVKEYYAETTIASDEPTRNYKPFENLKPPVSSKPKPKLAEQPKPAVSKANKPLLPPLKLNLRPPFTLRQNSGLSTPDTASSFLTDGETAATSDSEPDMMSVKTRMKLFQAGNAT